MAFAAWFGLLATALNLFPIGQLDGGHISYAVLGRRSTTVTLGSIGVAIALTFFSISWLVWTFLLVAMTLAMGPRHPPIDDIGWITPSGCRSGLSDSRALLYPEPISRRNCSDGSASGMRQAVEL
jgi:membrane-associated protease RseP (regulator of RpoE activity)